MQARCDVLDDESPQAVIPARRFSAAEPVKRESIYFETMQKAKWIPAFAGMTAGGGGRGWE